MKILIATTAAVLLAASPLSAKTQLQPVENKGLSVTRIIKTGPGTVTSTVFVKLANPNDAPVEVRNVVCQFHQDGELIKKFSIKKISVQPGESQYEAPEKVEGMFNKAACNLGK